MNTERTKWAINLINDFIKNKHLNFNLSDNNNTSKIEYKIENEISNNPLYIWQDKFGQYCVIKDEDNIIEIVKKLKKIKDFSKENKYKMYEVDVTIFRYCDLSDINIELL